MTARVSLSAAWPRIRPQLPQDARIGLAVPVISVVTVAQVQWVPVAAFALGLALGLMWATGRARALWHRLVHLEAFLLLLLVTLPFGIPGTPAFQLGPLTASFEGLARAVLIAVKIQTSALLIAAFLGCASPEKIAAALQAFRLPEPLVQMMLMVLRYLRLLRDEAARLQEAMRIRAFRPRTNRHTWVSYGNLAGMMLVRAHARALRVEEAMRCRGYAGRMAVADFPPVTRAGWLWLGGVVVVAALFVVADRL